MEMYSGVINWFFETGCEGAMWVFEKDGFEGYDALVFIEKGDCVKIFAEDGSIVFEGEIMPDYNAGWTEYPLNLGRGQPSALGFWIHWAQKGWEPDKWAELFFNKHLKEGNKLLKAELIRK